MRHDVYWYLTFLQGLLVSVLYCYANKEVCYFTSCSCSNNFNFSNYSIFLMCKISQKKWLNQNNFTFLMDAGENRAEEEVAQLEDRSWNCMLWAVTSCEGLTSWNFVILPWCQSSRDLCPPLWGQRLLVRPLLGGRWRLDVKDSEPSCIQMILYYQFVVNHDSTQPNDEQDEIGKSSMPMQVSLLIPLQDPHTELLPHVVMTSLTTSCIYCTSILWICSIKNSDITGCCNVSKTPSVNIQVKKRYILEMRWLVLTLSGEKT